MKIRFFILATFLFCSLFTFSQNSEPAGQKTNVKIEIGHHILSCPELPRNLKLKLMGLKGISDYLVNRETNSISFSIPKGEITSEEIVNIAIKCAFPAGDVKVFMTDSIEEKK